MTMRPLTDQPPPDFIRCYDCASTVHGEANDTRSVIAFYLTHSGTCPTWPAPTRELAAVFGHDHDTINAELGVDVREQGLA